jgi:ATP-dependent DNA helicase RecG
MRAFAAGEIDVLVSTTVVEVGVDVPNATVMVVEHAERFGLSQLHQLRGRVGRGAHRAYCCLVYQAPLSDEARGRLKAMTETTDGFVIAERDLALRGPGDFFGTRQAGVPTFRLIDLVRDRALLEEARGVAAHVLETEAPSVAALDGVLQHWAARFRLIEVA